MNLELMYTIEYLRLCLIPKNEKENTKKRNKEKKGKEIKK